jgi:hypothetical protein
MLYAQLFDPAMLAEGSRGGWAYQVYEPLPDGHHRRVPARAARVDRIVDELRDRTALGLDEHPVEARADVVRAEQVMPRTVQVGLAADDG